MAFTEESLENGTAWNNEMYAFDKHGEKIQLDISSVTIPYKNKTLLIWSLVDVKDLELRQLNKNADKVIRAGLKNGKRYKSFYRFGYWKTSTTQLCRRWYLQY